jgi:ethanolamine ammonia-lyase small subunit
LLRAQGVKQEKIDIMLNDGLIAAAIGRSAYAQRQALNTFWTLQMSAFGINAMKHRARLITHGTAADWIRFFYDGPASFIAEFDLPM